MQRVTGIGGVFFKSQDPAATRDWYRAHLGVETQHDCWPFCWREREQPEEIGYTVWSAFPASSDYFDRPFMINYRVADLPALLEAFKAEGVVQVGEMKQEPNGKFAWILDPDGNKLELWEPVPSAQDPYL